ncbi:MAG TPA: GNAT family N-acetyltransferase [Solirubrobacteraceae bacterium]
MRWVLEPDLDAFHGRVRSLLEARIENNVVATVLSGTIDGQFHAAPPVRAIGLDERGAVAAAAMRTTPWPMLCTGLGPGDAGGLLELWLEHDPELPGVSAPLDTAHAVAAPWARRTGGTTRCRTAMAMHALATVVDPPRPGPGRLVLASADDRELALRWWSEFVVESHVVDGGPESRIIAVDSRIARRDLWLWEDEEAPVCMLAGNPAVAGAVRIGPVYTPPRSRRRGYASSAVAGLSRHALATGAHARMLFTDLSNPTSNKIYADVGYRRIGEWEETEFTRPA